MKHLDVKTKNQTSGYCGPMCLKMVLAYFGCHVSEARAAKLSSATRRYGVEAKGLVKAARAVGFRATVKDKATFRDIENHLMRGIPVIVDWFSGDDGHYSVVTGLTKSTIYLADPELGRVRKLSRSVFRRVWFDFSYDYPRSPRELIIRRMIVVQK